MKAVVYNGPKDVSVNTIDDPKIEKQTDVIIRLTTTNICGSDLHMYEGRTSFEKGRVFGHENLGEVIEVGAAVDRIKKGDRVCMPLGRATAYRRHSRAKRGYRAGSGHARRPARRRSLDREW